MKTKSLYPIMVVENMEDTIAFYTDALGYRVKHDAHRPIGRVVVLANDADCELELMEVVKGGPVPMKPGLYGFRMNIDDMDEALKEVKAKGCEIVAGPMETGVGKNLLIRDINGVNITLIQHVKK